MFRAFAYKISTSLIKNQKVNYIRFISTAEDYEVLHHLIEKRTKIKEFYIPESKFGGISNISMISDKIVSLSTAEQVKKILKILNAPISLEDIYIDVLSYNMEDIMLSVLRNKYALNFYFDQSENKINEESKMNDDLNLYVSIIKLFSVTGFNCKVNDINIVMLIQNRLGDNTKLEYEPVPGLVETITVSERDEIIKIITYAFTYAKENNRKKITFVHKQKMFNVSDCIFLKCVEMIKKMYPETKCETMEVDEVALNLILDPKHFDIICSNERYGSILTSIASGICGGPALFSCSNIGDNLAIFQPLENKLSTISQNKNLSPYGVVSSISQLLLHMNHCKYANILWNALLKVMLEDKYKTTTYGGCFTDDQIYDRVIHNLKNI